MRQLIWVGLLLLLLACAPAAPFGTLAPTSNPTIEPPTVTPGPTSMPTLEPTASPTADPRPTVAPLAGCVDGWLGPLPGSPEYEEGVEILSGYMGVAAQWQVGEMRYFTGPDAPWIIEPRYEVVERWYIKAALENDPDFRGRWLLEKRTERILGVSAVAAFDSRGYASPDWYGFVGDGPPTAYPGLPGLWSGVAYDFVTGEGDTGQPGLPAEVVDCLAGS